MELNLSSYHTTMIVQTQVDFHRRVETDSWILMSHIWHDMTSFLSNLRILSTDLKTWMAGSAEKLRQSGRHIGPVKKPS